MPNDPLKPRKYPGRDRVMSRDDARDYLFRERFQIGTTADPCEQPYEIAAIGLPSRFERDSTPLPVELQARCRKCSGCLRHRRRLWTARAVDEVAAANRTWFGTLTIEPYWRFAAKEQVRYELQERGTKFDDLLPSEQFTEIANFQHREVTRFIKRVRKQARVPVRYLLVTEAHKSGDPHFHLLLHEPREPVRKALLEEQWRYGFSQWRLVEQDRRAAVYVCKYLAKDALTRVRASQRYGQPALVRALTERTRKVRDALSTGTKESGETSLSKSVEQD